MQNIGIILSSNIFTMINYSPKIFNSLILAVVGAACFAQDSINSGATLAVDGTQDIIVSSSIGQIFYQAPSDGTNTEVQGVQQPLRFEPLSIDTANPLKNNITLYPNPATDFIKLRFSSWESGNTYRLLNLNGAQLAQGNIEANDALISITGLAAGVYLLAIRDQEQPMSTIKFIKK